MSIFPIIAPPAESARDAAQDLPLCREVAWDFDRDIPIFRQGEPVVVTGKEAVKVWVWRALRTPRYRYDIHTWAYGSELESLVGQSYSEALKTAEAARYLRECLLINPYILAVSNVSTEFSGSSLSVSCKVETIYGEVEVNADL